MAQISLTDFLDIVSKSGRPKATKVRQVRERPDYEPAFDFYKPFREYVVEMHRTAQPRAALAGILPGLSDPKKSRSYPALIDGYKKWWGRKKLAWFSPPKGVYSAGAFEIIVNPELGLEINGQRHIIKLYLKTDSLSAFKVEVVTDLLEHQLRPQAHPEDRFAVLDVRGAKLFAVEPHAVPTLPIVNAELAYIASIWGE